jgi:hypothetical protein
VCPPPSLDGMAAAQSGTGRGHGGGGAARRGGSRARPSSNGGSIAGLGSWCCRAAPPLHLRRLRGKRALRAVAQTGEEDALFIPPPL